MYRLIFAFLAFIAYTLANGETVVSPLVIAPTIVSGSIKNANVNGNISSANFTNPVSSVNCIPYYDGVKLACDSIPSHLGYNAATDTVYLAAQVTSAGTTSVASFVNTGAQSTTSGSGILSFQDDGSAMSSGNRLGYFLAGGAYNASGARANSVGFGGFATENWSATNQGGSFSIYTTPNGATTASRRTVATFSQDGSFNSIGNLSNTGYITTTGTAATDLPTLGAEFLTGSGWTSTGWTGSWAGGWVHTAGNVSVLSFPTAAVSAAKYYITYTITGRTAGSFSIGFGGLYFSTLSATGAQSGTTTTTGSLTVTPTTDFNGTIVISIKALTSVSTPLYTAKSSEGTARIELRSNNAANNLSVGLGAGGYLTTGAGNTFIGSQSGANATSASDNVLVGEFSGQQLTSANTSVFVGPYAGTSVTSGIANTFIGYAAGAANTTGTGNIAVGALAGRYLADGSSPNTAPATSTYIGYSTRASSASQSNETVIGYSAIGNGSNTVTLGNTSVTKTYLRGDRLTNAVLEVSATAPTISSGFGTSPTITGATTAAFTINVGTGGTASSGVITLPTATNAWACAVSDTGTTTITKVSAKTTSSITLTNYTMSSGATAAWSASSLVDVICQGR